MLRPAFFTLCLAFFSCKCENDAINDTGIVIQDDDYKDTTTAVLPDTPETGPAIDSILITFTYTTSWCNGHAPSDEDLAEINTARRLYNTPLRLVNSNNQSFDIITDKKGRIRSQVPPGSYSIFFIKESDYTQSPVKIGCDLYYEPNWGDFQIPANHDQVMMNIRLPCDLCDEEIKRRP